MTATALVIAAVFLGAAFFSDVVDPRVQTWRRRRGDVALVRALGYALLEVR